MSFFSGLSRPMRAAGVALIGVAVIAAIIGGVTALSGGGPSANNAGPTSSSGSPSASSPAPGSSSSATPPSSSAVSSAPSSAPGSPSGQPSTQPGQQSGQPGQPGQPGDQQASNKWVTLRVYNNSLVQHLAEQAANDFRGGGWNVAEVGNYSQGVIPHTTAYFRPGTDEEAAAKQLAAEFGFVAEPRFEGIQNSSPGVIVIITKDYQSGHKGS
ncbi:LytR C-terminal domain-containing protein [Amycolatopsis sp. FDAARGOS 1241]|uniref:LytR C-terminal domain-containing protein n=1 Tax=Amycolatopsis sp. FDAARGOS 1241 TaxID=2778070 RepID=UPI00194DF072|nr:LytR C-terminal domain-containing protein [Amycolatopsis sp. FDAARGOS 1241]QRP46718.1 LytR C-terminal domain-containing protein [Amycolatopsis sp. FDAARGOS 1241]